MKKKQQYVEQDFNLSQQQPLAGETRQFPLGEALFFSPKPLPSINLERNRLGESNQVLAINNQYLDIGQSSQGKAFQVQSVMTSILVSGLISLIVFAIAGSAKIESHPSFWNAWLSATQETGPIVLVGLSLFLAVGWYVIISTSLKKSRIRPIRFHRQRREVCYFPEGSDNPVIAPWEEVVCWVSIYKGYTGNSLTTNATFGLAFPIENSDEYWMLKKPIPIFSEGQRLWEIIRCYMDESPDYWASVAKPENRTTFDEDRRQLHHNFKHGPKRWFFMNMLDPSTSYMGVIGYYVFHILSFWKLPYLISEWDSRISLVKYPEELEQWSRSLPKEKWAKPSEEFLREKMRIDSYLKAGGYFTKYRKSNPI